MNWYDFPKVWAYSVLGRVAKATGKLDTMYSDMERRREEWDLSDKALGLSERLARLNGPQSQYLAADQYARMFQQTRDVGQAQRALAYIEKGLDLNPPEDNIKLLEGVRLWLVGFLGEDVRRAMDEWDISETAVSKSRLLASLEPTPKNYLYASDIRARIYQQSHDPVMYEIALRYANTGLDNLIEDPTIRVRLEGVKMWLDVLKSQS